MERFTPAFDRLFDRHYELNAGEPFCRTMAWLWICHEAQWKDGPVRRRGETLMLKRGEVLCSLRWFAGEWGWSVKKVRNFVAYLHDCGKLKTERGTAQGTVYSLVNYDVWRSRGTASHTVGAQGTIEETTFPSSREASGGDVEKPPEEAGPLESFGVPSEAVQAARRLDGFDDMAERALLAQYKPDGMMGERMWKGVEADRAPFVIGAALLRVAQESDDGKWRDRFFGFKLRGAIEEELLDTPADQAKARSAKSPVGRLSAEQESAREAGRAAEARARQTHREVREAEAERDRTREQAQRIHQWLESHPDESERLETEARTFFESTMGREPPKPVIEGYILAEAEKIMEQGQAA